AEALITTPTSAKGIGVTAWLPVYGTNVIPKNGRAFVTGDFNRVPVVIGSNRDEGRLFANGAIQQGALKTPGQFENNLRREYGDKWQKVKKEYLLKHFKSVPLAYSAVFTDSLFACSA